MGKMEEGFEISPPKRAKLSLADRFKSKKGSLARLTGEELPESGTRSESENNDPVNNINEEQDVKPPPLSDSQRAKIERNRQKALLLKQARLAKQAAVPSETLTSSGGKVQEKITRIVDSGGGFLIEEEEGGEEEEKPKNEITKQLGAILQDHLPDSDESKIKCKECEKPFADSFLFNTFDLEVCDACRDNEEKHRLITKTDAKNEYLLKDEDLTVREPVLKYILKKNPHNSRWGDMKLFLHCQIYDRAMEVHGSEEALEEKHDQRDDTRQKMRQKKFDKKVKELRRKVRSSLFTKNLAGHEHDYEEEEYDSDKDEYSKKCKSCDHVLTYEKM